METGLVLICRPTEVLCRPNNNCYETCTSQSDLSMQRSKRLQKDSIRLRLEKGATRQAVDVSLAKQIVLPVAHILVLECLVNLIETKMPGRS